MKNILKTCLDRIKKNYGIIFIFLLYIACIIKTVYYVGMADSPYHFGFHFIYGLRQMGGRIIILLMSFGFLFSFSFLFKGWLRYVYATLIYAVTIGFCFGDLAYTRFFQGPASLFWKIMPHNSNNDVTMGFFIHYSWYDLLWFSDILFFIPVFVFGIVKGYLRTTNPINLKKKLIAILTPFALVIISSGFNYKYTIGSEDTTDWVSSYGNFLYHMADIVTLPNYNKKVTMSSYDKKLYYRYETILKSDEDSATDALSYDSILANTNLLVFQMEAVESFVIGNAITDSKGISHEITPNMNSLLSHSVQMNAYEQVRSGNSSDCDLLFMTGQYPVSRVITFNQFPQSDMLSLADVLKNNGYKSTYLNGAYGSTWNYTGVMEKTLGFDKAYFGNEILNESYYKDSTHKNLCGYIADEHLLKFDFDNIVSPYISSSDKYYSHVVMCSSHIPYPLEDWVDEEFLNHDTKLESKIGHYMYNYISLVHYVDKCIGQMLSKIDLSNTTVVIMGDHGGIHKYMSNRTKKMVEGKSEYKWMTKASNYTVPALIYNQNLSGHTVIGDNGNDYNFNIPAYRPDTYIDKKCGQIDILSTLSYMMGIKNEFTHTNNAGITAQTLMGRNMLKTNLSYCFMANGELRGSIPKHYKTLNKGMHLSNVLIKSLYFGKYKKD